MRLIWPMPKEPLKQSKRKYPGRRQVLERTLALLPKRRAILVRYDKKPVNYLDLIQFACPLSCCHRLATFKSSHESLDYFLVECLG
jgi:hypothetical protein